MATTSSNSSLARRQQLCAEYVNLPTVYSHIRIESYIKLAYAFYNEGLALFESKYYVRSYIEFKKFTELSVAHLSQHKSYDLIRDERMKLMVFLKIAVSQLQIIARILDEEEDEKLLNKEILDLVDAFEEKDEKVMMERLQQNFSPLQGAPPPYDFNENNGTDLRNRNQFSHEEKITVDRFSETNRLKDLKDDSAHIWNFENKEDLHLGQRKTFEECVRTLRYNDQEEKEEEKSPYYQFIPEFVPLGENVRENGIDEEEECPDVSVLNRLKGVSDADVQILSIVSDFRSFFIPHPNATPMEFRIEQRSYVFTSDDFHVSFTPFLQPLRSDLQMNRAAVETNRCFFLHLGVAMQIHPFGLQVAFRHMSAVLLQDTAPDDMSYDLLMSVQVYAGYVDANCLIYLWPKEFDHCRICFISGPCTRPIFSCFLSEAGIKDNGGQTKLREVIIHCNGSHFTLLTPPPRSTKLPPSEFSFLSDMLAAARLAGLVVQENVVGRGTNPISPKDTGAGAVGGKRVKGGSFSVIRTLEGIRGPTQS